MKLGENDILKVSKVIIFTKFHEDWTKNVDFLLSANFVYVSVFYFPDVITRIGAQCYKYTGRSDAYFFIHVQGPLEDSHFQTQLANTLDKRIC